jgi:hypothetical protein
MNFLLLASTASAITMTTKSGGRDRDLEEPEGVRIPDDQDAFKNVGSAFGECSDPNDFAEINNPYYAV